MAYRFKFPDVGEGIHEGKVVEWLVREGDTVAEDQPFVKVETDKAVVELPSPAAGTVLKIYFEKGATVRVGEVMADFGERGEKIPGSDTAKDDKGTADPPRAKAEPSAQPRAKALATPHTRALARGLGVDLGSVSPSGKGGRITDEDVRKAAARTADKSPAPGATQPDSPRWDTSGREERVRLSHLRQVIASNMALSRKRSAHVTHVDEADVTGLYSLYSQIKEELLKEGKRITLMPFFVKALVECLKEFPKFNGSVDEEKGEFIFKNYYNIGFAADTEEGLIVPVIKDAGGKSLVEIAEETRDLSEKARRRALSLDELRGGTCTITNIGPLGGIFATPIIHQPELAIVGFHAVKERPWVVEGEIRIRKIMYVSVSFDHKYIDGAEAARFMSRLVHLLEKPALLLAKG